MKSKLLEFILFFYTLCSLAYWQVPLYSKCHKPKNACICKAKPTPPPPAKCKQCGSTSCRTKDKHKVCPTYGQYDFKCRYNFKHPCSQCGKADCNTKNKHEKCPTCGEYDFKCRYDGYHPIENFVPEYVDLGLSVMWATCNVGATHPEEYGDYFAWGETKPKKNYDWSTYKWSSNGSQYGIIKYTIADNQKEGIWYYKKTFVGDNKTTLDLEDDAAHVNWGRNWRMPTRAEQDELRNKCTWTWTTQNGVDGYKVTSKSNSNSIFLPAAGYRLDGSLLNAGSCGHYWSSSLIDDSVGAFVLGFCSGDVDWDNGIRYYGRSVRAVCQ